MDAAVALFPAADDRRGFVLEENLTTNTNSVCYHCAGPYVVHIVGDVHDDSALRSTSLPLETLGL